MHRRKHCRWNEGRGELISQTLLWGWVFKHREVAAAQKLERSKKKKIVAIGRMKQEVTCWEHLRLWRPKLIPGAVWCEPGSTWWPALFTGPCLSGKLHRCKKKKEYSFWPQFSSELWPLTVAYKPLTYPVTFDLFWTTFTQTHVQMYLLTELNCINVCALKWPLLDSSLPHIHKWCASLLQHLSQILILILSVLDFNSKGSTS